MVFESMCRSFGPRDIPVSCELARTQMYFTGVANIRPKLAFLILSHFKASAKGVRKEYAPFWTLVLVLAVKRSVVYQEAYLSRLSGVAVGGFRWAHVAGNGHGRATHELIDAAPSIDTPRVSKEGD